MGFYRGPQIVTSGLIMSLDAGNTKSYLGTGTMWYDRAGNLNGGVVNNGTLVNSPAFNAGNKGSIVFNGTSQYVSVNNSISNPTELTIISFINGATPVAAGVIWAYRSGTTELIQLTIQNSTTAYFQVRGSGNTLLNVSLPITMGSIYMVAGIFNKTTGVHTLYVNTTFTTNTLNLSGQTLNSTNQYLGISHANASPYKGSIYSAQLYNRALSSTEVLQNYNATKSRFT